jgi:hypothetical protein
MADPSQKNVIEGGTQQCSDDAIEVRTGTKYSRLSRPVPSAVEACKDASKTDTGYNDGISIHIKCDKNPHLIQFIYRELIGADGKPIAGTVTTTGGTYDLTTDPSKPNWNTDSSAKPNPYYDAGFVHRKDDDGLTTFDEPAIAPGPGQTRRATFKAYAVCDGKVVREITWVREQKSGSAPTYTVSCAKADKLPDWATNQLKANGYNNAP